MVVSPDLFLLIIGGGGVLVILACGICYFLGCIDWIKYVFTPTPSESSTEEDQRPKTFRGRLASSFTGGPPRPIGTGFYTSSPFWSAPVPVGPLGLEMNFDNAFPPPEWMSGYLYGLQAALGDNPQMLEVLNSFLYSNNGEDGYLGVIPDTRINVGNLQLMAHLGGTIECDEPDGYHTADGDHSMDFGDGGAGAAGF